MNAANPPLDVNVPSQAMLRPKNFAFYVPGVSKSLGTNFAFPVGDVGNAAVTLYIANPDVNGGPVDVDIFPTPNTKQTVRIELNKVVAVPLTAAQTRVSVSAQGGALILVQLAIMGQGKNTMTVVLPL